MLLDKLQAHQIEALKKRDTVKLETLRYILSQIKNREIEKQASLTDEEVLEVLKKHVKNLHESIAAFKRGNRADLASQSEAQLDIVSSYLPPEISDEDLAKEVQNIYEKNKVLANENPQALIGVSVKALKDKASPQRIIKTLQALIAT